MNVSVTLMSTKSGWTFVEWGGINECKSSEKGHGGRIEWNEIDLGVILMYSWDILECINVNNSCTPFHMKICNSQNSFGGGTIM